MRNQRLKWTSSHVRLLFDFHSGARNWWRSLVRPCVLSLISSSPNPSPPDLASSTWESSCSSRKGASASVNLAWDTAFPAAPHRKQVVGGCDSPSVFHWIPLHIKHFLMLFPEASHLMGKAKFIVYAACLIKGTMRMILVLGVCIVLHIAFLQVLLLSSQWTAFHPAVALPIHPQWAMRYVDEYYYSHLFNVEIHVLEFCDLPKDTESVHNKL